MSTLANRTQVITIVTAAVEAKRRVTADELATIKELIGPKVKRGLTEAEKAEKDKKFRAGKQAAQKRYVAARRLKLAQLKVKAGESLTPAEQAALDAAKEAAVATEPAPAAEQPAPAPRRSRKPAAAGAAR
jgi:hypothetical protein